MSDKIEPLQQIPGRFSKSYNLVRAMLAVTQLKIIAVAIWPSPEFAQVVIIDIPLELGLVAAWTHVTNWAEVKR